MSSAAIVKSASFAVFAALALSGCAHPTGHAMAGMGGEDGPMAGHRPHMMMQALGCPHGPMDMAAMKAMTPDQHKAMMDKHVADCRAKLLAEGQSQARAEIRDCINRTLDDGRGERRKVARARVGAAVAACTQTAAPQPSAPPAHQH
jgi:hypothetical protein